MVPEPWRSELYRYNIYTSVSQSQYWNPIYMYTFPVTCSLIIPTWNIGQTNSRVQFLLFVCDMLIAKHYRGRKLSRNFKWEILDNDSLVLCMLLFYKEAVSCNFNIKRFQNLGVVLRKHVFFVLVAWFGVEIKTKWLNEYADNVSDSGCS